MEKKVSFSCEGFKLAGTLFTPVDLGQGESRGGIIICKGFGADARDNATMINFARHFYQKGYIVLTLDRRGFEESKQPRLKMIPIIEVKDIRSAIAFFQQQPEVDRNNISIVELH
jgi:predicted alpha/beta hydrolase